MARWVAGAKWAEGPAPDAQRDMPLVLSLSEGLGRARRSFELLALLATDATKADISAECKAEINNRSCIRSCRF